MTGAAFCSGAERRDVWSWRWRFNARMSSHPPKPRNATPSTLPAVMSSNPTMKLEKPTRARLLKATPKIMSTRMMTPAISNIVDAERTLRTWECRSVKYPATTRPIPKTTAAALKRRSRSSSPLTISRGVAGRVLERGGRPLRRSARPPKRPRGAASRGLCRPGSASAARPGGGASSSSLGSGSTAPRVVGHLGSFAARRYAPRRVLIARPVGAARRRRRSPGDRGECSAKVASFALRSWDRPSEAVRRATERMTVSGASHGESERLRRRRQEVDR